MIDGHDQENLHLSYNKRTYVIQMLAMMLAVMSIVMLAVMSIVMLAVMLAVTPAIMLVVMFTVMWELFVREQTTYCLLLIM